MDKAYNSRDCQMSLTDFRVARSSLQSPLTCFCSQKVVFSPMEYISTSFWSVQYPNACQNLQQIAFNGAKVLKFFALSFFYIHL